MRYLLPNWLYDVLKWVGLVLCPALAVFYGTVAPGWGWPYPEQMVLTINAFGVLIGVLIGASHLSASGGDINA